MRKYFRVGFPLFVIALIIMNFVLSVFEANSSAMWANLTAFFGWLIVAADEYQSEKAIEQINKDTV